MRHFVAIRKVTRQNVQIVGTELTVITHSEQERNIYTEESHLLGFNTV
jgi:hypothetical protein